MNKPYSSPCNAASGSRSASVRRAPVLALALVPLLVLPALAPAQSLWKNARPGSLVSDNRARAIGDIVTILVQESNSATKDNSTSTSKKTSLDASISSFLYSPAASGLLTKAGQLPAIKAGSANSFDGGGKVSNSEKLDARIAVRVAEVLPNGSLVLEGTKKISFAGETQDAVLRGVVRQEDITANNTVFSYNLADVQLKYVSKGQLSDSQRKGWFTRVWDKVSPF
jgi:flagellar L-ring protein FlgH